MVGRSKYTNLAASLAQGITHLSAMSLSNLFSTEPTATRVNRLNGRDRHGLPCKKKKSSRVGK